MSPDVYDAYRTAGIHVRGVWDWYLLQIDVWGLPVVIVWQIAAVIATWCGLGALWHLADRLRDRRIERRDRAAAWRQLCNEPPAEQQEPGIDAGLYLDCVAIYGDCEELDRLRDAIDQTRKEKP